jgi:hypothetical protein
MQYNFKISWYVKQLWTGHKIYSVTDYVNLWHSTVTLTLNVEGWLLHMTHRPIIVNICAKYFQNRSMDKTVMGRTRHIPSKRQCWPLITKCDLDLEDRDPVVLHDTSSYYIKHLCQVILNSFDKWHSYWPDTKMWRTDGAYFFISHLSKRRDTIDQSTVHPKYRSCTFRQAVYQYYIM